MKVNFALPGVGITLFLTTFYFGECTCPLPPFSAMPRVIPRNMKQTLPLSYKIPSKSFPLCTEWNLKSLSWPKVLHHIILVDLQPHHLPIAPWSSYQVYMSGSFLSQSLHSHHPSCLDCLFPLFPKWLVPAHSVLSLNDASSKRPSPAALSMLATITLYHIILFYFFMELNIFFKIAFCLSSYLEHMLHKKRNLGHGIHPASSAPRRVPGT